MSDRARDIIEEALDRVNVGSYTDHKHLAAAIVAALEAAGIALVELPEPRVGGSYPVVFDDEPEDVYAKSNGDIVISGVWTMTTPEAFTLAAALLAAANRAEANQ